MEAWKLAFETTKFNLRFLYILYLNPRARGRVVQWSSTWGTRTAGGTRRHLTGYIKLQTYIYIYVLFRDKH
jgi:hypothetical protein